MVESQPSKLLVASSILVSRSIFSTASELPQKRLLHNTPLGHRKDRLNPELDGRGTG